jgi:hypothetical protein
MVRPSVYIIIHIDHYTIKRVNSNDRELTMIKEGIYS